MYDSELVMRVSTCFLLPQTAHAKNCDPIYFNPVTC